MERISLNTANSQELAAAIAAAGRILAVPGNVALVPTETVYGLTCRWDDRQAVERIYDLKQRSDTKPLALFVAGAATLAVTGAILTPAAQKLAAAFCPGPITLIVPNQNNSTTGFRIPDHPLLLGLLQNLNFPLAQTSANRSGRPNSLTVDAALAELCGTPDLVIDAGPLPADARASTVVNLACDPWKILREGPIPSSKINLLLQAE